MICYKLFFTLKTIYSALKHENIEVFKKLHEFAKRKNNEDWTKK